ncbi:MAG: hypothetical protein IAE78_23815, partial [Myxococcus sp.]|nr:hypothetical protein [Myxococcus sp.]
MDSLVGPLRFAAARDFANLATVKSLSTPLLAAIDRARASVPSELIAALEREVAEIDAVEPPRRRASVGRVLLVLAKAGLEVPGASSACLLYTS